MSMSFSFYWLRFYGNGFYEPVKIGGISIERMLAAFGKLCVAIFAFNSGVAIWKKRQQLHLTQSTVSPGIKVPAELLDCHVSVHGIRNHSQRTRTGHEIFILQPAWPEYRT